ncbi:hypothetical protein [Singulisphaera sp. GP187]|uniref:endonuclease III domain-containing protein n=1 Tax=Singulisphaera sp. GP187 TaxID=1882752 RepID=UPI000940D974
MTKSSIHRTGTIWTLPTIEREATVEAVCDALEIAYGRPRLGNPEDPLDDLIYIILSNKTSSIVSKRLYVQLKQGFESWDELLRSSVGQLREILRPGGLSEIKSLQIRALLAAISRDFGACDLAALKVRMPSEIEAYLKSLPGVSTKVAKCAMLFTMDAAVLPVDAHVHRVSKRIGWTSRKRADQCHEELEALVPPERRFAFHVDCIEHGRSLCRPLNPACDLCPVNRHCAFRKTTK